MKRPLASLGSALLLGIMIGFICFSRLSMTGYAVLDLLAENFIDEDGIAVRGTVSEIVERDRRRDIVLTGVSIGRTDEGESIEPEFHRVYFNVRIYLYNDASENMIDLEPGDFVEACGIVEAGKPVANEGGFDKAMNDLSKGIGLTAEGRLAGRKHPAISPRRWMYRINTLLSGQAKRLLPIPTAGPVMTMLLGNDEELLDEIRLGYQVTGLSHLLAISGLHVALLGFGIYSALCKLTANRKIPAGIAILFTWFFCLMTMAHTSTIRASIMLTVQLLTRFNLRRYDGKSGMFLTLVVMLLWEPWQLFGIGFQLSFLAVGGILYLYKPLTSRFGGGGWVKPLALIVSVNVATFPVLAANFHQFPTYSIIANLIVVPFMGIVVGMGSIALAISFLSFGAGAFLAGSCHYLLSAINGLNSLIGKLPLNMIHTGSMDWVLWTLYMAVCCLLILRWNQRHITIGFGVSAMAVLMATALWQSSVVRISVLDVGQGDASAIAYKGRCWLVDGGGWTGCTGGNTGEYVLLPFLKAQGCQVLEGAFVTHSDYDHIYGIIELLSYMKCKVVYLPVAYDRKSDELLDQLMAAAAETGTKIVYLGKGDMYRFGALEMTCLAAGMPGENNNNQSLVMDISFKSFDMLLAADGEKELENWLLESKDIGPVEILKVGHHGSETSSSEGFVRALQPETAIISVGEKNRFGHPSQTVVELLEQYGAEVLMTKNQGEIDIWTAGFGGKYLCKP